MNNVIKVEVRKTYVFKDIMGGEIHLQQADKPWNDLVKLVERPSRPTGSTAEYIIVAGLSESWSFSDLIKSAICIEKGIGGEEGREIVVISGTANLLGRLLKPVTT